MGLQYLASCKDVNLFCEKVIHPQLHCSVDHHLQILHMWGRHLRMGCHPIILRSRDFILCNIMFFKRVFFVIICTYISKNFSLDFLWSDILFQRACKWKEPPRCSFSSDIRSLCPYTSSFSLVSSSVDSLVKGEGGFRVWKFGNTILR